METELSEILQISIKRVPAGVIYNMEFTARKFCARKWTLQTIWRWLTAVSSFYFTFLWESILPRITEFHCFLSWVFLPKPPLCSPITAKHIHCLPLLIWDHTCQHLFQRPFEIILILYLVINNFSHIQTLLHYFQKYW